ncbi:hypothetical protein NKH48_03335 [Mesorhizobium sp. M1233]|uniref:hypothetical protein n=1 Tax=Mesorhizobium sp. M1233 TaxID=2957072 RepID=UPI003334E9F7
MSVAFTFRLPDARQLAIYYGALGLKVFAGGPALAHMKTQRYMQDVAWVPKGAGNPGRLSGALQRHNPAATIASRGCSEECSFCIVPFMEGGFTQLPDFPVLPVLCDNNLSGLPADYQDFIVRRYQESGVPLLDANSGFEPRTFSASVFDRWRTINRGVWRLAYDDLVERDFIRNAMTILRRAGVSPRKIQIYTLLGNEPYDACMQRVREVIEWGGEPFCQPLMKLVALTRDPHVKHDWTARKLRAVARWANNHMWRSDAPRFEDYNPNVRRAPRIRYDERQGLFI